MNTLGDTCSRTQSTRTKRKSPTNSGSLAGGCSSTADCCASSAAPSAPFRGSLRMIGFVAALSSASSFSGLPNFGTASAPCAADVTATNGRPRAEASDVRVRSKNRVLRTYRHIPQRRIGTVLQSRSITSALVGPTNLHARCMASAGPPANWYARGAYPT